MEKITLNGKRYIALGEFDNLRHNLVRDIYDRYEKDENGQFHLSDIDMGQVSAYAHIMTEIMREELDEAHMNAEGPDGLRAANQKVRDKVRAEFLDGRYMIVGRDDDGEIYFRKMCPYVPKEGEEDDGDSTPVFTGMKRLAATWTDHYQATNFCKFLTSETKIESLKVMPCWQVYMTEDEKRRLLEAIFRDADDEEEETE